MTRTCHQLGLTSTLLETIQETISQHFFLDFEAEENCDLFCSKGWISIFDLSCGMCCTIRVILEICSSVALSKLPEGPVVLGGGLCSPNQTETEGGQHCRSWRVLGKGWEKTSLWFEHGDGSVSFGRKDSWVLSPLVLSNAVLCCLLSFRQEKV